jgi:hypothetical protein
MVDHGAALEKQVADHRQTERQSPTAAIVEQVPDWQLPEINSCVAGLDETGAGARSSVDGRKNY